MWSAYPHNGWATWPRRALELKNYTIGMMALYFAVKLRKKGYYTRRSLKCYLFAWQHLRSTPALIRYVEFRRDMGMLLTKRLAQLLQKGLGNLNDYDYYLALSFLLERTPELIMPACFSQNANGLLTPPLAASLPEKSAKMALISEIHQQQAQWREAFRNWVKQQQSAGICVVGNAASLTGKNMGHKFDQFGAVIRFNLFQTDDDTYADIGTHHDAWVMAPGFRGYAPQKVKWCIITGPDMRFRLSYWDTVLPLLHDNIPVLTVPLPVWRDIVAKLKSPPSAGIVFLAFLRELLGSWEGVHIAGIGTGLTLGGRYHRADSKQHAVTRHDWHKEARLIRKWQQEGLSILDDAS